MNPVILIPGYYGCKLAFADDEDDILWLDGGSFLNPTATLRALHFDPADPNRVVPVGVLDEVVLIEPFFDPDIYRRLGNFLRQRGLDCVDAFYDWRRSLREEADRLAEHIDRALHPTGASQVSLVGHSFGGLLARAYLQIHGPAKVERLITLGAPHKGMLKTFEAMSNGKRVLVFFPGSEVRDVARTAPSAFELLPNDPRDGLFEWGGQSVSPLSDRRWCDQARGPASARPDLHRMTREAEQTVNDLLPNHLPVETHLIYGTRRSTPGRAFQVDNGLAFRDVDDGDGTVPTISASGRGLTGPGGLPPRHYPIPFGRHMLIFNDTRVRTILADLLQGNPRSEIYFQARFERELVLRRTHNRISVDICDANGPITDAEVRLSIEGTNIRDRPIPATERGDYLLERLVMPHRPVRQLSYRVEAKVPGLAEPLVSDGKIHVV